MKKLCCIGLAMLLCLGLSACQSNDTSTDDTSVTTAETLPAETLFAETLPAETLPSLAPHEVETIIPDDHNYRSYVYGEIVGKLSPNVLVLKMDTPFMVNTWGETVYIITDKADEWCIGDEIEVRFSLAECPLDTTQYTRIIADEVYELELCAKPIIYFYPETPTLCSAKITLSGDLTCTYPAHGKDGWQNFTAYPDGTLIFPDGSEYYALYWEGKQGTNFDFSQGFCVKGEDTASFLAWALKAQGLTAKEANEFIIYWLPLMQNNPYNVISFQTTAYTEGAVLDITPTPDSLLRVFMAYYPSSEAVEIAPQTFAGFDRQGFTVVEWGGSEVEK